MYTVGEEEDKETEGDADREVEVHTPFSILA